MDRASGYRGRHENHVRLVNRDLANSLAWLAAVKNALSPGWVPGLQAPNRGKAAALGRAPTPRVKLADISPILKADKVTLDVLRENVGNCRC